MKKKILTAATVVALSASMLLTPSCIGSFALSNRLLSWNQGVGNKFLNELVFVAFWVLPVYEVCGLADVLVLNSIEFWSNRNPVVAQADRQVEGSDGVIYAIHRDESGYDITNTLSGETSRLQFNDQDQSWSLEAGGESTVLFNFIDDTHIALPDGNGGYMPVEISQAGLYAYSAIASQRHYATR